MCRVVSTAKRMCAKITGPAGAQRYKSGNPVAGGTVKICELLMATMYYAVYPSVSLLTTLSVARPKSPEFLSSLEFLFQPTDSVTRLASSTFHLYLTSCFVQVLVILCMSIVFFAFSMSDVLQGCEIASSSEQNRSKRSTLGPFRCCHLLMNGFNELFANLNAVIHAGTIAFATLCMYGAARSTDGMLAAGIAYLGLITLVCYLQMVSGYAEVNLRSKWLLWWMRSSGAGCVAGGSQRTDLGFRQLRSLRELRVQAGTCIFHYDKATVLITVEIILVQSANLLIMQ